MTTTHQDGIKFRKRAEELRAEAVNESDPTLRKMLLDAADAFEEMARWKPRKSQER